MLLIKRSSTFLYEKRQTSRLTLNWPVTEIGFALYEHKPMFENSFKNVTFELRLAYGSEYREGGQAC